jgi:uncharacterized protein
MAAPGNQLARAAGVAAGWGEQLLQPAGVLFDEIPGQAATLDETGHRPWPLPGRPWLMGQTWRDLLFAHWEVSPGALRRHVPEPLELDRYEGSGWLGITPFEVTGLRPRGAPPPPLLSRFLELNVRTYVRWRGKPGIYFFSLDCSSAAAVAAARRGYRLPYFRASAALERRSGRVRFELERRASGSDRAAWRIAYRATGPRLPVEEGSLERWLTERYCLYVVSGGRVMGADIHHRLWPLQPAEADIEVNSMTRPLGVDLRGEPLLHLTARQDTLFWALADLGGQRR